MFTKGNVLRKMNTVEKIIILYILSNELKSQRAISKNTGFSLGGVNKAINSLIHKGYLDEKLNITSKCHDYLKLYKPKKAVILAAGVGIRLVPINRDIPKALLTAKGEILIERIIKHLHEVGIYDISIVVGFMKERFEYLIDKYKVNLIVNNYYKEKNNLYSLSLVANDLSNTYIIPCDIWCENNPFSEYELYSWYMVSNRESYSWVKSTKNLNLVKVSKENKGNKMIGVSYIGPDIADDLVKNIRKLEAKSENDSMFWEQALFNKNKFLPKAKIVSEKAVFEINTYEELRDLDKESNSLNNLAINIIKKTFNVEENEITNIKTLKKGMTNRSFLFDIKDNKYIMRIPGEGTDKLINRKEEYEVYNAIKDLNISDEVLYMNPQNGYKITKYINNARTCDIYNNEDLEKCMKVLRNFHNKNIKVDHSFDLFDQIDYYEKLMGKSNYDDYNETKRNVLSLRSFIEDNIENFALTHIDAVPDNFLIYGEEDIEKIKLIDWEYSGMQDVHVDIAMFAIYALYDKEHINNIINIYFKNKCPKNIRIKIYCYIAVCGLLWSNWCEYKMSLGVDFGEYALKQYRYAKDYYQLAHKLIEGGDNCE